MKIKKAIDKSDRVVAALKHERKRLNISQYKLAQLCGLSKTSIALIERYDNKPTLRTLFMISDALNIDLGEIIKNVSQSMTEEDF